MARTRQLFRPGYPVVKIVLGLDLAIQAERLSSYPSLKISGR